MRGVTVLLRKISSKQGGKERGWTALRKRVTMPLAQRGVGKNTSNSKVVSKYRGRIETGGHWDRLR